MDRSGRKSKPRPPLTSGALEELALRYVGRFATTEAKLRTYLVRKVRERGWEGEGTPAVDTLVERFVRNGYVDDAAYAMAQSRSLAGRGFGTARVRQKLHHAGIREEDRSDAVDHSERESVNSALHFARRRRIGPFADRVPDMKGRQKAIAAMIRAGHGFELARRIVDLEPGSDVQPDNLDDKGADKSV